MKALIISIVIAIAIVGCVPMVTQPKDLCVKYSFAWNADKNIPKMTVCVCTEEIFPGLKAALDMLTSFPDDIKQIDQVPPSECKPDAEKVPVNDGDASVKELLSQ